MRRRLRWGRRRWGCFCGCAGASLGRTGPAESAPSGRLSRHVGLGSAGCARGCAPWRPPVGVSGARVRAPAALPAFSPAVTLPGVGLVPPRLSPPGPVGPVSPRPLSVLPALYLASSSPLEMFAGSGQLGCPPLPGSSVHHPERRPLTSALTSQNCAFAPDHLWAVLHAAPAPSKCWVLGEKEERTGSLLATSSGSDSGW